ncbi:MAG: hypothetical protein UW09_C0001G0001, partial [candidate division TM6 bacterium GW2011_GWF2_43_87]
MSQSLLYCLAFDDVLFELYVI